MTAPARPFHVHVHPTDDLIEHDLDDTDCVCGPETRPAQRDDGAIGWIVIHHALDNRERAE